MGITLFTIGFTNKSAEDFFELLRKNKIRNIIDTRRNNKSQLAGFAKGKDLKYLLDKVLGVGYEHDLRMAPSDNIIKLYREKVISWEQYENIYLDEIKARSFVEKIDINNYNNACFLCSEHRPDNCHRRILVEYLKTIFSQDNVIIKHLY